MTNSGDHRWRSWAEYNLGIQETLLSRSLSSDPIVSTRQRLAVTRRLENLLQLLLALLRPELVVEIGAHGGEFSIAARQTLPDARIVAFEANKAVFKRYAATLQGSQIEFHNLAVSDCNGTREFGVPKYKGKLAEKMGSLHKDTQAHDIEWVEMECVRADSILADSLGLSNVLWVDVEGAALEVLTGARELLPYTQLIYVEIETRQRWENQRVASHLFELLEPYGLIPLLRDVMRSKWQYNCLIGRPELLQTQLIRYLFDEYLLQGLE